MSLCDHCSHSLSSSHPASPSSLLSPNPLFALLPQEIKALSRLERSTLSADVAQGFSLLMLAQLLNSFLAIEQIKEAHKGHLVGVVLHSYLGLRCLVVQRTKKIEDAESLLLKILEDLTSGTEEEKKKFMAECVAILDNFSSSDLLTPVFVFERLCNMILPEKSKEAVFFLQLDKDPQQEEFLQGKMQGNPYRCTDPGLGPLMRDIKNKICTGGWGWGRSSPPSCAPAQSSPSPPLPVLFRLRVGGPPGR